MPCGEQTTIMERLGRVMRKLAVKKGSVLLGEDWNMSKENVKKEAGKWLLDTPKKKTGLCWTSSWKLVPQTAHPLTWTEDTPPQTTGPSRLNTHSQEKGSQARGTCRRLSASPGFQRRQTFPELQFLAGHSLGVPGHDFQALRLSLE
ncbi:MAG: uncharacterized protein A8A55_2807 [Amphiamblys sp. WSBS2006]|nr:MAG: uncharacterized protein A8A55_2807 [Amphiamblys sp. WSBS2006]